MSFPGFILLVVLLIVLVITGLVLFWPRMHIVEEGRAVVVYRLGRVARFAGPGPVWTFGALESIKGPPFDIRNKQVDVPVPNVLVNGIPTSITFGIWCRFDPLEAAGRDKRKWTPLVLYDETERGRQLQRQIQEVLPGTLAAVFNRHPVSGPSTIVDQVLPLLPSTPENATFRTVLLQELWRTLPGLGLIPDKRHELVFAWLGLPQETVEAFGRDRIVSILRLKFPDLPDDRMTAMLSAIEGKQLPIKTFVFEGTKSQPKETRFVEDGMELLQSLQDQAPEAPAKPPGQAVPPAEKQAPASQPPLRPLTKEDWMVLKPMPRYKGSGKKSA